MFVYFSTLENFALAPTEFFIILVPWPVKIAAPIIYSVYLKDDPLSKKLS